MERMATFFLSPRFLFRPVTTLEVILAFHARGLDALLVEWISVWISVLTRGLYHDLYVVWVIFVFPPYHFTWFLNYIPARVARYESHCVISPCHSFVRRYVFPISALSPPRVFVAVSFSFLPAVSVFRGLFVRENLALSRCTRGAGFFSMNEISRWRADHGDVSWPRWWARFLTLSRESENSLQFH